MLVLREAYELYLHVISHKSVNTVSSYKTKLKVFLAYCARYDLDLKDVTPKVYADFLSEIAGKVNEKTHQPFSSATINGYATSIKVFLTWTTSFEDYLGIIKPSRLKLYVIPRCEEKIKPTLTHKEIHILYEACKKEITVELVRRDTAILSLLLDTGIRSTELCTLTLKNVHLDAEDSYILVSGKGRKEREIGIGQRARIDLFRYIRNYRKNASGHEVVFVSRTGGPLVTNSLDQMLTRLKEWANISKQVSAHIFRHTYARMYLENGGDVYKLSRLMGHTSVAVTEIYLRSFQAKDARKNGVSVLDSMEKKH